MNVGDVCISSLGAREKFGIVNIIVFGTILSNAIIM